MINFVNQNRLSCLLSFNDCLLEDRLDVGYVSPWVNPFYTIQIYNYVYIDLDLVLKIFSLGIYLDPLV